MATPLQEAEKHLVLESCFSLSSFPIASELFLIPLFLPQSPSNPSTSVSCCSLHPISLLGARGDEGKGEVTDSHNVLTSGRGMGIGPHLSSCPW